MNTTYKAAVSCFFLLSWVGCSSPADKIIEKVGKLEYHRLMSLSPEDFDQSANGFRQYSNEYDLLRLLIPEYIRVKSLPEQKARNMRWHLGQIHAINGDTKAAVEQMRRTYSGGSKTWSSYVTGSIAFLEKDRDKLMRALDTLNQQENQMNIEILERFAKYFESSYAEVYNALQ